MGERTTTPWFWFRKGAVAYEENGAGEKHHKKHHNSHAKQTSKYTGWVKIHEYSGETC